MQFLFNSYIDLYYFKHTLVILTLSKGIKQLNPFMFYDLLMLKVDTI
jgi:hypothetical protein